MFRRTSMASFKADNFSSIDISNSICLDSNNGMAYSLIRRLRFWNLSFVGLTTQMMSSIFSSICREFLLILPTIWRDLGFDVSLESRSLKMEILLNVDPISSWRSVAILVLNLSTLISCLTRYLKRTQAIRRRGRQKQWQ